MCTVARGAIHEQKNTTKKKTIGLHEEYRIINMCTWINKLGLYYSGKIYLFERYNRPTLGARKYWPNKYICLFVCLPVSLFILLNSVRQSNQSIRQSVHQFTNQWIHPLIPIIELLIPSGPWSQPSQVTWFTVYSVNYWLVALQSIVTIARWFQKISDLVVYGVLWLDIQSLKYSQELAK